MLGGQTLQFNPTHANVFVSKLFIGWVDMAGLKGLMHFGPVKFLKCALSSKALGDEMISKMVDEYADTQRNFPDYEPHKVLSVLWMVPFVGRGENPLDETLNTTALTETFQFACVAPPNNARCFGLYYIYKERPDIIQDHYKFGQEYDRLMAPVLAAMENGSIDRLYQRYNPMMARDAVRGSSRVAEQSYSEEQFLEEVDRLYEEVVDSKTTQSHDMYADTAPHAKTGSKIVDPLLLQCHKCDQSLNVPRGRKLKLSCPKCGHSWVHNGITEMPEPLHTPKDNSERTVEKSVADRVTNFTDRPKSKLQLREERQALEEEADVTSHDDIRQMRQNKARRNETPETSFENVSRTVKEEDGKRATLTPWLREEWEFLQRKRAKGRQLDDYELGLERQYEEAVRGNNGRNNSQDCDSHSNIKPRQVSASKIEIHCVCCDQTLSIPGGKRLNVTCPKCETTWMYDGRDSN
jgi:hypothetical protein